MFPQARPTQRSPAFLLPCLQMPALPEGSFSATTEASFTDHSFGSVGLSERQSASSKSEADWDAQHPALIGLFSILIGSDDSEEIQTFIRRLRERGNAILGAKQTLNDESLTE